MDEQLRRHLFGGLLEQMVLLESKTRHRFELLPRLSPQMAGELAPGPSTVHLTSLDLTNPREFERAYQLFLTGALPEAPQKGAFPSLRAAFAEAEAPEEDEALVPPQPIRALPKVGRNAPCPCGSGKKYKRCCGR